MTIVPATGATPIVELFVLRLNTLLAETPRVPAARAGAKRAAKREAAQRKAMKAWHKSAAKAHAARPESRQVRRCRERPWLEARRG